MGQRLTNKHKAHWLSPGGYHSEIHTFEAKANCQSSGPNLRQLGYRYVSSLRKVTPARPPAHNKQARSHTQTQTSSTLRSKHSTTEPGISTNAPTVYQPCCHFVKNKLRFKLCQACCQCPSRCKGKSSAS